MSVQTLATKLYIPLPRPRVVLRTRLIERLNEGLHGRLTLISAPAGFGKTTLVSEWLAGCERPAAWLSLDAGDNDPARFLTYLIAALQTIAPGIGDGVLAVLQSPQPPAIESVLTTLLNEIVTVPAEFRPRPRRLPRSGCQTDRQALTFLLEHLPPQMHLVIATREDPQLPLARLRARGQLTELRAADLRFTPAEAAEFLERGDGPRPLCRGYRGAGDPHRRLDCRPATGRALHAGAPGRHRLHQVFHRQPPFRARLLG